MRRSETLYISIKTPFDKAWDLISHPENLNLWTVDFVLSSPKRKGDVYQVETKRGFIDLFVKSNQETGIIDFYFGRDGQYACSPSRLLKNDDGVLYIFTQFEPTIPAPELFEKLVSNVRKELLILKDILESN